QHDALRVLSRADGAPLPRDTADPRAAIIAPLSVQYRSGGMRTSIPSRAPCSAMSSRSRELAENPPPMTNVVAPTARHAASDLVTSTSTTASENEAAM